MLWPVILRLRHWSDIHELRRLFVDGEMTRILRVALVIVGLDVGWYAAQADAGKDGRALSFVGVFPGIAWR